MPMIELHHSSTYLLREGRSMQYDGIAWNHSEQPANKTERYPAIARKWSFLKTLYDHEANVITRVNY